MMANAPITSEAVTGGQRKQVVRFAEDAVDRAIAEGKLGKDGIQRLIGKGDEFQADVVASVLRLSAPDQFADEEVVSRYGYLSGYKKPRGITKQTNVLRQLFPGIGYADEQIASQPFPKGAEGWFAIPRWQKVAPTYPEAVQKVLDLIAKARGGRFYNYRAGQIDQQHIRQSAKTARMFQVIGDQQKDHDILVVPCQLGLRHAGRSVRRAREVMNASEFGLDSFSVGIMLLTHPERLQDYNDLWIDCGDEFSAAGDGRFGHASYFCFDDDEVEFDSNAVSDASGNFGSASGFASQ